MSSRVKSPGTTAAANGKGGAANDDLSSSSSPWALLVVSHTVVVVLFFLFGTKMGALFGGQQEGQQQQGIIAGGAKSSMGNHSLLQSFFLGTGLSSLSSSPNTVEQVNCEEEKEQEVAGDSTKEDNSQQKPPVRKWEIPKGMSAVIAGAARVHRGHFLDAFDSGLPYEEVNEAEQGQNEILLLYDAPKAWPKNFDDKFKASDEMPYYEDAYEATENCKILRVVHVDTASQQLLSPDKDPSVCIAIQGQATEPHYHVHKWIRQVRKDGNTNASTSSTTSSAASVPDYYYKAVGRYHTLDTKTGHIVPASKLADPPKPISVNRANQLLQYYLSIYRDITDKLRPIVEKSAVAFETQYLHQFQSSSPSSSSNSTKSPRKKKTVVVMICNAQQAELLVNLACKLRSLSSTTPEQSEQFSLKHYLVFAMDDLTQQVAERLGFSVFFDPALFAKIIPSNAGNNNNNNNGNLVEYGTMEYAFIMMAKLYVPHLISVLRYNIVFHDVDVLPYQADYLYSLVHEIPTILYPYRDMYFQYDHSPHIVEYQPWHANSGFYFSHHNERTAYFFSYLLRHGDILLRVKSHQAVMNMVLSDVANQYGLHIKVLRKESDSHFPVGYQFHHDAVYMKSMLEGKVTPKAFHMNWNNNMETKRQFLQQMGAWYVKGGERDGGKVDLESLATSSGSSSSIMDNVCVATPTPVCFYRDKPSVLRTCQSYPFLEYDESFW